jgi:hypothetical protein
VVGIGRALEAIKDDKLGTSEFLFSSMIKVIHLIRQRKRFGCGYPLLIAPGTGMKRTTNVKSTPAPGYSTKSYSLSGKQILGLFGLKEMVSLSASYLNLRVERFHSGMRQKHSIVSAFVVNTLVRVTNRLFSSSIINILEANRPSCGIGYFFFDGRDSQNALQRHDKLIRSLISQFSHQRGGTPTGLADLYKHCGDHQQPSVNQLQSTLRDILDGFAHAYIVIDALDECADREKTLVWVNKVVSGTDLTAENLHIMVTSRPEQDIEKGFRTFDSIDVGKATANRDILKYLELQMESNFKEYNAIIRKKIESGLRERAEGSYVYP